MNFFWYDSMKIISFLFQGFLHLALLAWPMLVLLSAMIFDAPGSKTSVGNVFFMLLIFFYPVIIGLIAYSLDWRLFFLSPKYLLPLASILSIAAFVYMGGVQVLTGVFRK